MFTCFAAKSKDTKALSKNIQACVTANVLSCWQVLNFYDANKLVTKIIVDVARTGFTLTLEPPETSDYTCTVSSGFNGSANCVVHACETEEDLKLILQNSNLAVLWFDYKIKHLLKAQGFTKINRGEYELTLGNGTTVTAMPTFGPGSACFLKHTTNEKLPRDLDDLSLMITHFKRICAAS